VGSRDGRNDSAIVEVVLSSRRVKKGPGRRPLSAKRRRFMELRERGLGIDAAAREVGVSRTAGRNWANGYRKYRAGQVVGFVPGLDRLEVREVSARFLSEGERVEIADLHRAGLSGHEIARRLGRAPSTISRELRRNATAHNGYRPFEAHRRATARRARCHRRRVDTNVELRRVICELLGQRWSPEQISRHLRQRFPADPAMRSCHESIYQALYQPGSPLMRPSPLAPQHRSPLRTGRDHRRAQQRTDRRRPRFEQPRRLIHQRPFPPEGRSEAGYWEGDLIIGKDQQCAIGTLVERQTRLVRLLHLPRRDSDALHKALRVSIQPPPTRCACDSRFRPLPTSPRPFGPSAPRREFGAQIRLIGAPERPKDLGLLKRSQARPRAAAASSPSGPRALQTMVVASRLIGGAVRRVRQ
jgi:IS30 family transposase